MTAALRPSTGLPDPDYMDHMYRDVASKRLFAWVIDVILISALTALVVLLTFFTGLIFLPFLYGALSFGYRWISLASRSATPGMRVMAIELRNSDGAPLSGSEALMHTGGYFISVMTFPLQMVSMAMMLMSARGQGLSDAVLGTAMLNRPSR